MRYLLLALTTFTVFTLNASDAWAQGTHTYKPPNSEFKNQALEQQQAQQAAQNKKKGFLRPNKLYVSLVSRDYFEDDQFGLLFKLKDIVSGCFKYSPLEYQVNFVEGNYMEVAIKHYRRQKIKTDNPNKDCPSGSQAVSALIVLSKSDMKSKGVYEMRLSNGAAIDRYSVAYYDDRIEIIPLSMTAFKAENLQGYAEDRLIHYKKQEGVLALHVPMANAQDNVADAVMDLAAQKGLSPIDIADEKRYPSASNVYYFVDNGGTTIGQLDDEKFIDFGTVQSRQAYEGTAGINEIDKPLKVFATKPGTTL